MGVGRQQGRQEDILRTDSHQGLQSRPLCRMTTPDRRRRGVAPRRSGDRTVASDAEDSVLSKWATGRASGRAGGRAGGGDGDRSQHAAGSGARRPAVAAVGPSGVLVRSHGPHGPCVRSWPARVRLCILSPRRGLAERNVWF